MPFPSKYNSVESSSISVGGINAVPVQYFVTGSYFHEKNFQSRVAVSF